MFRSVFWCISFLSAALIGGPAPADCGETSADTQDIVEISLERWLVAGPVPEPVPLFHSEESGTASHLMLDNPALPSADLWATAAQSVQWRPGRSVVWRERTYEMGEINLVPSDDARGSVALLTCYLDSPRWQKIDCVVRSRNALVILLDGEEVARSEAADKSADEEPETAGALTLPMGKSRLLIRTAAAGADSLDAWHLRVFLKVPESKVEDVPEVSLTPRRTFARLDDLSRIVGADEAVISPDGGRFVVSRRRWMPDKDRWDRFLELRELPGGNLERVLGIGAEMSSPAWAPDGKRLALTAAAEEESDLWVLDLEAGSFDRLLKGKKSLSNVTWSHDGRSILYTAVADEETPDEPDYERLTEPYMRWPGWKDRSHLWVVSLDDRIERQLTAGEFSVGQVTSCVSRPLVAFIRTVPIEVRPYQRLELWTLDVETLQAERERDLLYAVVYDIVLGPGGDRIAWVASPSETDTSLSTLEHNAYEQDLYVWNRETKAIANLTGAFNPSVGADLYGARSYGNARMWWNPEEDRIYFTATDKGRNRLYRVDPDGTDPIHIPVDPTAVYSLSGSGKGKSLLLYGSYIDRPALLYRYDFRRRRLDEVLFPGKDVYSQISFGRCEQWDFFNSRGQTIEGWIYYPPGFDEAQVYPMIVYYYGGVFPNGEAYVYRNHYLAANGYVVYVLNPAGATGYGPNFADLHVNDWGELAAQDIIEGVEKVLEEKSFIDRNRVGAFGGSYGGFLTMQLLTKTDLFAAAEASYGISNITSYWGEGRWGYLYGDVALAGSYPWNRPDIFVERSPLFHADRVTTPLLLTHGTGDTNVPSGESDQMFTALRVLRRDVVYVRFPGQEHGIVGTQSIRVAHNEIRCEWFDKYLKDQPEAWDARWEKE